MKDFIEKLKLECLLLRDKFVNWIYGDENDIKFKYLSIFTLILIINVLIFIKKPLVVILMTVGVFGVLYYYLNKQKNY
jgi:hypothetical protein